MITKDEWLLVHNLKELLFYFAEATDYLGESKYCTYSSINPIIVIIMIKVYSSTSFIINFNLNETDDAFDEILELKIKINYKKKSILKYLLKLKNSLIK